LVRAGHVFAETGLFARYAGAESDAKSRKVGVWSGEGERPASWKARLLDEARKRAPNNCPVKGVRGNDGLRYLMPWNDGYARARVRTSRGERWFCSEAEARAAGYQPSA
jgi:endonuclease YncB( thermonuclease family)